MRRLLFFLILLSRVTFALPSFITFPSDVDWRVRDSDHFRVLFRHGQEDLSVEILKKAEKNYQKLTPFFPEAPSLTWIVVADFNDSTNGYALTFPYPHIVLFIAPPDSTGQLSPEDDWLDSLILHEYTHILHLYPASGLYSAMRFIFGSWVVPNGLMPTHFHEGMATFMETYLTKGGRGRGTIFPMYRRMAVLDGKWDLSDSPQDRMDGAASVWPHGTSSYFFGYYMTEEMFRLRGQKGIFGITDKFSGNVPYFISSATNSVFGLSHFELWDRLFDKTRKVEAEQIEELRRHPLSNLEKLTTDKFFKGDVVRSPVSRRIAFRANSPSTWPRIVIWDVGEKKVVDEIEISGLNENICWGTWDNKEYLVFAKAVRSQGYSINTLFAMDLATKRQINLGVKHVQRVACSTDLKTIFVYEEVATKGTVKELKVSAFGKRRGIKVSRRWPLSVRGEWVSSLLVTADSAWIALRQGLSTSLWNWRGGNGPTRMVELPYHVYNLREGDRSNELLAITTKDGRDEIWRIIFNGAIEVKKAVSVLGGLSSFDRQGDEVYATSYEHGGYDVVKTQLGIFPSVPIAYDVPQAPQETSLTPNKVRISEPRGYTAWSTIFPRTWIPTLLIVPDGIQIGAWVPAFDIAQKHFINLMGGYDTRGAGFLDLAYTYRFPNFSSATINPYFYPNYFFSQKVIQKNYGVNVFYSKDFDLWLPVTLNFGLSYKKAEASPLNAENISVGPEISVTYRSEFRKRPLDVAPQSGTQITLSYAKYFEEIGSTNGYFVTGAAFQKYWRNPLIDRHVLFTNFKIGFTEGTSFFNSNFQAGGENIFSQARSTYLNRGYYPGSFIARRIANANFEYIFPLLTVDRGVGLTPAFLKNVHAAATFDVTSIGSGLSIARSYARGDWFRNWYTSAGGELRTDWEFLSYLPAQVRAGLYHAFGDEGENLYFVFGVDAALSF